MKQEIIAGIVLCILGLIMSVFPKKIWIYTEKLFSNNADAPSPNYMKLIRVLSRLLIITGVLLAAGIIS